jgi:hypothetical protein
MSEIDQLLKLHWVKNTRRQPCLLKEKVRDGGG